MARRKYDDSIPFWRKRIFQLVVVLLAVIGYGTYRLIWTGPPSDAALQKAATTFLEAGDRGEFEVCRKMTAIPEERLAMYRENRKSLGELKSRDLRRQDPLRFNTKTGFIYFYSSKFENANIREVIAVLGEPEKPLDIFSVRYEYERLPRPESSQHYNGIDGAFVRQQAARAAQAYDRGEWKYFEAIARRDTGHERRNAGAALKAFQDKFGKPINRTSALEMRYTESLPGCVNLAIIRVLNQTSYKVKDVVYLADEYVYLVLDRAAEKPEWAVYAFNPGMPRKITKK
jgi:hypothetical protein